MFILRPGNKPVSMSDLSSIWQNKKTERKGPFWEVEDGQIHCGDSLQLLKGIKSGSIDCIVTSPPYNIGPKNGRTRVGSNGEKVTALWRGIHDYSDVRPEEEYQAWQREILAECIRVLKEEGSIFYNHKIRQRNREIVHPMSWFPDEVILRQEIIWDRNDTHNHDKGYFYPVDERIFWLTRQRRVKFQNKGYSTVWRFRPERSSNLHNAPFPVELPSRCIEVATDPGDIVLDPFAGSGTTLQVARNLGRRFLGFEIQRKYFDMIVHRMEIPIAAGSPPPDLCDWIPVSE